MDTVVGRDAELAEIGSFLDLASGAPRVLLIEGDAGIGKTTLWRVAVEDVQWVDRASAECLAYALRRVEDDPIAFLLARRVGADNVETLERGVRVAEVHVEGLSMGALARLLHDRFGVAYPRPTLQR